MDFKIIDNGVEVTCKMVMTFSDDKTGISYVIYTDGTKDNDGELEIYASRYTIKDGKYLLENIEKEEEWDLIDKMLDKKREEIGD